VAANAATESVGGSSNIDPKSNPSGDAVDGVEAGVEVGDEGVEEGVDDGAGLEEEPGAAVEGADGVEGAEGAAPSPPPPPTPSAAINGRNLSIQLVLIFHLHDRLT